jgi:hypothetical protein
MPAPIEWRTFWISHQFFCIVADLSISIAIIVECLMFESKNDKSDTSILSPTGWIILQSIMTTIHIIWFLVFYSIIGVSLNKHHPTIVAAFPPIKTIIYGEPINSAFCLVALSIAYATQQEKKRFVEFLLVYLLAQFSIYINHIFALWNQDTVARKKYYRVQQQQ